MPEEIARSEPPFRPSVVTRIGSSFVVLDDLQPRALIVAADDVREVPSTRLFTWADRPIPSELRWPWRTAVTEDDDAWVIDGPGTAPIGFRADPTQGVVRTNVVGEVPRGPERRVARTRFARSRGVAGGDGGVRSVHTSTHGVRFGAEVRWRSLAGVVRTWALGRGAVVGCDAHGDVLAVTVRRADKRPWRFRPHADLALMHPDRPAPRWVPLPSEVELRGSTWTPTPVDISAVEAAVDSAHGYVAVIARHGGGDVVVSESEEILGELALPVVTTTFSVPTRPGVRCVRRDEPISELGLTTGGLCGMTVLLDEDLTFGFLPELSESRDGVLYV